MLPAHVKNTLLGLGRGPAQAPRVSLKDGESKRQQGPMEPEHFYSPAKGLQLPVFRRQGTAVCDGAAKAQHGLHPPVLATNELPDELLQLLLTVPAGKCRGQVEQGTRGAGRLLQDLGHAEGL